MLNQLNEIKKNEIYYFHSDTCKENSQGTACCKNNGGQMKLIYKINVNKLLTIPLLSVQNEDKLLSEKFPEDYLILNHEGKINIDENQLIIDIANIKTLIIDEEQMKKISTIEHDSELIDNSVVEKIDDKIITLLELAHLEPKLLNVMQKEWIMKQNKQFDEHYYATINEKIKNEFKIFSNLKENIKNNLYWEKTDEASETIEDEIFYDVPENVEEWDEWKEQTIENIEKEPLINDREEQDNNYQGKSFFPGVFEMIKSFVINNAVSSFIMKNVNDMRNQFKTPEDAFESTIKEIEEVLMIQKIKSFNVNADNEELTSFIQNLQKYHGVDFTGELKDCDVKNPNFLKTWNEKNKQPSIIANNKMKIFEKNSKFYFDKIEQVNKLSSTDWNHLNPEQLNQVLNLFTTKEFANKDKWEKFYCLHRWQNKFKQIENNVENWEKNHQPGSSRRFFWNLKDGVGKVFSIRRNTVSYFGGKITSWGKNLIPGGWLVSDNVAETIGSTTTNIVQDALTETTLEKEQKKIKQKGALKQKKWKKTKTKMTISGPKLEI